MQSIIGRPISVGDVRGHRFDHPPNFYLIYFISTSSELQTQLLSKVGRPANISVPLASVVRDTTICQFAQASSWRWCLGPSLSSAMSFCVQSGRLTVAVSHQVLSFQAPLCPSPRPPPLPSSNPCSTSVPNWTSTVFSVSPSCLPYGLVPMLFSQRYPDTLIGSFHSTLKASIFSPFSSGLFLIQIHFLPLSLLHLSL